MDMKQLVKRMQGGGFDDPRKPLPSPFPTRRLVQPTLNDRDRFLLETVRQMTRARKRKQMAEDAKFDEMVG
jgi:hypothetical protein